MTPEPSQIWTVAGGATAINALSSSFPAKGVATPPTLNNITAQACEVRRSVPRLWRWLIGVKSLSSRYLRLYCKHMGLSRFDLINTRLRRLGKSIFMGHVTPERLRGRTGSWVSESLERRTAAPSTRLDTRQCCLGEEPQILDILPQHIYKSLDDSQDMVRLLILDRQRGSDVLEATLVPSRLTNSPAYRALSYEWGTKVNDTSHGPKMMLNGHLVSIQPSLHQFLTRLKRYDDHLPLWIDALCINQADEVEKSRQVAIMGNIYHSADSVLVWLGNDSDGAGNLMRLINGQSPLRLMQICTVPSDIRHLRRKRIMSSLAPQVHPLVDELLHDKAAEQLLRRMYWNRAWIVQELVLARSILLFCSDEVVDFHHLDSLIIQRRRNRRSPPDQISMMRIARRNANSDKHKLEDLVSERPPRDRQKEDRTGWLPYLMEMFEDTDCTRRHDKVYSLLGLCHFYKEGTAHPIVPDYRLSTVQLFCQTFTTFLSDRRPKYAEILRRALGLVWQELLIDRSMQNHADCSLTPKSAFWWATSWGAAITKICPATEGSTANEDWNHFETDYIERHKHLDSFHPQIEQFSMETRGITKATVKPGDILLGLAGTAIAVILSEPEGRLMGLALMVGTQGAPGDEIAHIAYGRVLLPDFLTTTSLAGDCYKSGEFPVTLCVYQFITLLACAIPEYGDRQALPNISIELLRKVMPHGMVHTDGD